MQSVFLNPLHVVRSFAILLVVINHTSALGPDLHGGMNLLVILSGYSFALVFKASSWSNAVNSYVQMAIKLLIISLILAIVTITIKLMLGFNLKGNAYLELAHISNLFYTARNVSYPIWFVQCTVQFSILLIIITYVLKIIPKYAELNPLVGVVILTFMIILPSVSYNAFELYYLKGKTPDVYLSYFAIGIILYFVKMEENKNHKVFGFLYLSMLIMVIFVIFDIDEYGIKRYTTTQIALILIVFLSHLRSTQMIHYFVSFLSINAIGIFFTHNYVITLFRVVLDAYLNVSLFDYWYAFLPLILVFIYIFLVALFIIYDSLKLIWMKFKISKC